MPLFSCFTVNNETNSREMVFFLQRNQTLNLCASIDHLSIYVRNTHFRFTYVPHVPNVYRGDQKKIGIHTGAFGNSQKIRKAHHLFCLSKNSNSVIGTNEYIFLLTPYVHIRLQERIMHQSKCVYLKSRTKFG